MKLDVYNLAGEIVSNIELSSIFQLEKIRFDIIKMAVDWQLNKRRAGTHKTKTISEVSATTKKPHAQKGSGRARQGSLRSPHMRGGGRIHGPVLRSHEGKLNKKLKKYALCNAISNKLKNNQLLILDSFDLKEPKTKIISEFITRKFSSSKVLFVGDSNIVNRDNNFFLSVRNIPNVKLLPQIGLNVYDTLNYNNLVIKLSEISKLEERLSI